MTIKKRFEQIWEWGAGINSMAELARMDGNRAHIVAIATAIEEWSRKILDLSDIVGFDIPEEKKIVP